MLFINIYYIYICKIIVNMQGNSKHQIYNCAYFLRKGQNRNRERCVSGFSYIHDVLFYKINGGYEGA